MNTTTDNATAQQGPRGRTGTGLLFYDELLNTYSHVFGSLLFLTLPFVVYMNIYPRYSSVTRGDFVVYSTFFFGVAICFFLSATFHIFGNHSAKVHRQGNQLDYLGIVILMWGSTIPSVYYGFYCDPKLQKLYWSVVTIIASGCVYATLHPRFRHPHLRPWRAAMYAGLGLSAIVFIVHGLIIHGWEIQKHRMSLKYMALMGSLNITGAVAYATRVPERWYPLRYDIWGSSHQILYFMVIFACLAHMFGLLSAFDYLHADGSPCGSM
ncbi:Hly-III related protein [Cadophora sp. DSE1049]|nr:Hly-III related protein [Cadophora sp. DSE1049]